MKKQIISFLLVSALGLYLLDTPLAKTSSAQVVSSFHSLSLPEGDYEEGQVLVTVASPDRTSLTKEGIPSFDKNITVEDSWNFGSAEILGKTEEQKEFMEDKSLYVSRISSDTYSTSDLVKKLDRQAYVVTVEPDYYMEKMSVTNDPMSDSQWYLDGVNTSGQGIQYSKLNQTGSATPVVAVVDTGIDYTHEELSSHMWKNTSSSLEGTYGYDFGDGDSDPMDTDGHGTHCAGIIGATANNSKGIAGISPRVKLIALKVFTSSGKATSSNVIAAFNYIYKAQQAGVNIAAVNCSWGGNPSGSSIKSLISKIGKKGAVFIFAAGNDNTNHDTSSPVCPYDLKSPYVITVGASDPSDSKAAFSDYGASSVDLFAPGSRILSTIHESTFYPGLLPASQRDAICSYFSSFENIDTARYQTGGTVTVTEMSHSTEDSLGNSQSGSLLLKLQSSGSYGTFIFYVDVTGLDISALSSYYISYDLGAKEGNEIDWEHRNTQIRSAALTDSGNGQTFLRIVGISSTTFGSISELYLDNLAVSRANPDDSVLCQYNVYSGTSMAAPFATAAAAILASVYPKDTAVQRRERLLTCVRRTGSLTNYCRTGGILDLSKVASATYTTSPIKVTKVKLNKKKATLRYKNKLKLKVTIKPTNATNKKVKWSVSNKKYASVSQKGVVKAKKKGIGHKVKVYATAKDGSKKKAYCKVKIVKKKRG